MSVLSQAQPFATPWTVCSPPDSSHCGIFQARILEWVAISYSRGSSRPRDQIHVSCVSCTGRQSLHHSAIWEAWPEVLCDLVPGQPRQPYLFYSWPKFQPKHPSSIHTMHDALPLSHSPPAFILSSLHLVVNSFRNSFLKSAQTSFSTQKFFLTPLNPHWVRSPCSVLIQLSIYVYLYSMELSFLLYASVFAAGLWVCWDQGLCPLSLHLQHLT